MKEELPSRPVPPHESFLISFVRFLQSILFGIAFFSLESILAYLCGSTWKISINLAVLFGFMTVSSLVASYYAVWALLPFPPPLRLVIWLMSVAGGLLLLLFILLLILLFFSDLLNCGNLYGCSGF